MSEKPKAKNAIVFIGKFSPKPDTADRAVGTVTDIFVGDGMATSMIAAARLLAHKTVNGKYQTKMKMEEA